MTDFTKCFRDVNGNYINSAASFGQFGYNILNYVNAASDSFEPNFRGAGFCLAQPIVGLLVPTWIKLYKSPVLSILIYGCES